MGMAVAAPDLEPVPPFSPSPRYRAWLRANILPYALISPSVLVIAGILAFPLGMLVWLSLQHYGLRELIHHAGDWVGLDNYRAILVDPLFHQVIVRSLLFTFACVALTVVLSTLIALLLLKVRSAVRILVMSSLVFVWATPVIVSVDIWQWMFDYEFGVINYLLTQLHLGNFIHHNWFDNPVQGLGVLVVVVVWGAIDRHLPFDDLGLRGLQPDLRDAQPAAQLRLLHDRDLLLPGVVRRDPIRIGRGDRCPDGSGAGVRHLLLRARNREGGGDRMIAPGTAQGIRSGRARAATEVNLQVHVRQRVTQVLYDAIGVAVAVVMLFPIYWMVATAFKPGRDILTLVPKWFPAPFTLQNFQDAIARPFFLDDVKNSLLVVGVMLALALAISFLAAVATARFGFKGRTAFLVMIIGVQMVPLNALIIPLYLMLDSVGQTDALPGVIAVYLAVVLPFMVWTLRGFVANIPAELEESAMIDGCTRVGAFLRITFPLVGPGLVATAIFGFIQAWNEYIVAYVLLSSPGNQTLTVWLASFTTNHGPEWGPLMAAATLTGLPVVAFFLILQRYLAGGLTAGAVKG